MKLSKPLIVVGLAAMLAVACSEKSPTTTGQADQPQAASPAQVASQEETIPEATPDVAQQTGGETVQATAEAIQETASSVAETAKETLASATAEPTEIDGTLMQTEKGVAIVSDQFAYLLSNDNDLADLVGQKVKITGTIAETEVGEVLQVMSVTPVD
ncbi:hypothetical protein DSCO28_22770 [Desulfosarcina ovata subsp. sediminis]|uniref:DUF5666 domain-containing protein n=1 Tax=Desulfosarcina ovata subsp. sediminis TaxID=885957 RepID=A0A5K7ZLA5_9BACT|nr:hypothetical protein [Desulfosarcina ovata]BBO81711.1 hypothetical protein DSCO28_22770 [Desulfosarcina ovata subsp. sediminis]